MHPFMLVAFRADQHEFPRAVGFKNGSVENTLNQLSLKRVQLFSAHNDGIG